MARRVSEEVRIMELLRSMAPEKREVILNLALAEFRVTNAAASGPRKGAGRKRSEKKGKEETPTA